MRESRTSGSGRGGQGNLVPYRHRANLALRAARANRRGGWNPDLPISRTVMPMI